MHWRRYLFALPAVIAPAAAGTLVSRGDQTQTARTDGTAGLLGCAGVHACIQLTLRH
jgi:hypothetical protein